MKFDLTNTVIIVLVVIAIVLPASLYAYEYLYESAPKISDYCNTNGFREVFNCTDGSFQAIREKYTEGFRIVKADGSHFDCPFTLPQYQEGECSTYTINQMCGGDNLCEQESS
jgi:hypothetical protein